MIKELDNKDIAILEKIFKLSNIIKELQENKASKYFIYFAENNIIGYINYYDLIDRYEIANIEVLEEYRNQKIGYELLFYIIELGYKNKINNITLEVNINNLYAIKLYKKCNFEIIGVRKRYYDGQDGYLMERKMIMKDIHILAIESSCDETSCSIVKNGKEELATVTSTQIDIHKKYGGVVPEIASREHLKNITIIIEECLEKSNMKMEDIDYIAVTYGPGLIGSLLVGIEAAKTLSFVYNIPIIPVHHLAGHIYANSLEKEMKFPLIALVISGGHTELIYMPADFKFEIIGSTLDDAVGETYDKVARVIGIGYPGGPVIDKIAQLGIDSYELPLPMINDRYNFSFSGLKSAVINLAHNEKQKNREINKENLARSFQNVVVETIVRKTENALLDKKVKNLVIAGGVAANSDIRKGLIKMCEDNDIKYSFPNIKYCTDNATMIAAAAYYIRDRAVNDLNINAISSEKIN